MPNTASDNPRDFPWTETESTGDILFVEAAGDNTTLPEHLKGYRPGIRFKRQPPAGEPPAGDAPPADDKPAA